MASSVIIMKDKKENNVLPQHSRLYPVLTGIMRVALNVLTGMRFVCDDRVKDLKKGDEAFIVLCQHPSMIDAAVVFPMFAPRKVYTVAGRFQYIGKKCRKLFEMLGVIPKRQFYTDFACVRSMLAVLKQNGVLAFMPEGRISMDGTNSPIEASTGAFIKKCGVPVVVLTLEGSHFVMGSWRKRTVHLGRARAKASLLFEKEDLRALTASQVHEKIEAALAYNQFELQEEKKPKYLGRPVGISTNMYRCHACGGVGTFTDDGKHVTCSACGYTLRVGRDRFFYTDKKDESPAFSNLAAYNAWQKEVEEEFWSKADARLAYPAQCRNRSDEGEYIKTTDGILQLDAEKLTFTDKQGEILFSRDMQNISGVSADYTRAQFTMYEKNGALEFQLPKEYCIAQLVNSIVILHKKATEKDEVQA